MKDYLRTDIGLNILESKRLELEDILNIKYSEFNAIKDGLLNTDWVVIRSFETGKEIPFVIKEKRTIDRARLSILRNDIIDISNIIRPGDLTFIRENGEI